MGLSGLGDLTLTCTGAASRNYSVRLAIGCGEHAAEVLSHRTTATEGVAAARAWSRGRGATNRPRRHPLRHPALVATARGRPARLRLHWQGAAVGVRRQRVGLGGSVR